MTDTTVIILLGGFIVALFVFAFVLTRTLRHTGTLLNFTIGREREHDAVLQAQEERHAKNLATIHSGFTAAVNGVTDTLEKSVTLQSNYVGDQLKRLDALRGLLDTMSSDFKAHDTWAHGALDSVIDVARANADKLDGIQKDVTSLKREIEAIKALLTEPTKHSHEIEVHLTRMEGLLSDFVAPKSQEPVTGSEGAQPAPVGESLIEKGGDQRQSTNLGGNHVTTS